MLARYPNGSGSKQKISKFLILESSLPLHPLHSRLVVQTSEVSERENSSINSHLAFLTSHSILLITSTVVSTGVWRLSLRLLSPCRLSSLAFSHSPTLWCRARTQLFSIRLWGKCGGERTFSPLLSDNRQREGEPDWRGGCLLRCEGWHLQW